MRCACIDIGSNTTRLLVAEIREGWLEEVMQRRAFTRLGALDGFAPDKVAEVAAVVDEQVRLARSCGCEHIRAIGTHAIRQAPDPEVLLDAIEAAAGVRVEILSGEEEARLAFRGATGTLGDPPAGEVGVVDVGGGSSELVCGTLADGVSWSASFPLGSGVLATRHLHHDPPRPDELDAVRAEVRDALGGIDAPQPLAAFAVGGSATSLYRLLGPVLDHDVLERGLAVLTGMAVDDVAARFDLHPERVRVLPAGMVLLDAAAGALGAPLHIARGGLREGALLDQLERGGT
jgi:exopolyphosphatase / guanosine-5'-triphosphate,3'-diphosphate pyrophosphatase